MIRLEKVHERKKIVYFSLLEDFKGRLKVKQGANIWTKCFNADVTHLTRVCEPRSLLLTQIEMYLRCDISLEVTKKTCIF